MTLVDCDVHVRTPAIEELMPHLGAYWQGLVREAGFHEPSAVLTVYPPNAPTTRAPGADETVAGLIAHLDEEGAEAAILTCHYGLEAIRHVDFANVLATAVNDWLAAEWLPADDRLRAGIVVNPGDPAGAVAELERRAGDERFAHVLLPGRAERPYGNRAFWPLYEAAAAHGRPVALHFTGATGNPPTHSGWPTFYLEDYVGAAHVMQTQVTSLVSEGVFARFPGVRFVLLETGFGWLPPLLWRLDKEWRGLRREIPWVDRPPSEIVREHFRVAVQPLDGPPGADGMLRLVEQLGSDDLLLFSSDHPHVHLRTFEEAFEGRLPAPLERRIRFGNAAELYNLSA